MNAEWNQEVAAAGAAHTAALRPLQFMKNLSNPFWIKFKGILFLIIGIVAVILLVVGDPRWDAWEIGAEAQPVRVLPDQVPQCRR